MRGALSVTQCEECIAVRFAYAIGDRFGRWTVVCDKPRRSPQGIKWLARCDCGTEKLVKGAALRSGTSTSCGCKRVESTSTHGMAYTPTWFTWSAMKHRCTNPASSSFHRYGGRGIKVCDRWLRFDHFLADMGEKPSSEHSLDRIDNERGYEPGNCRWATREEQMNNTRSNVFIEFMGQRLTIADWSRKTGLSAKVIQRRPKRGWPTVDVLTWSSNRKRQHGKRHAL